MTGTLNPDVTGTYEDAGEHNGKRYYQRTPNGWFIWWDGMSQWIISTEPGSVDPAWWYRISEDIEGAYVADGTATGVATVTEVV